MSFIGLWPTSIFHIWSEGWDHLAEDGVKAKGVVSLRNKNHASDSLLEKIIDIEIWALSIKRHQKANAKTVICFRPQLDEWNETAALRPAFNILTQHLASCLRASVLKLETNDDVNHEMRKPAMQDGRCKPEIDAIIELFKIKLRGGWFVS